MTAARVGEGDVRLDDVRLEDAVVRGRLTAGRRYGERAVVLVVRRSRLFQLNAPGARLWELAARPVTVGRLVDEVVAAHDVDRARAREDVVAFAGRLLAEGVLARAGEARAPSGVAAQPARGSPRAGAERATEVPLETNAVFRAALAHQLAQGRPILGLLEVTNRCNLDCEHCYLVEGRTARSPRRELTETEMASLLDQLAELGVLQLTLSGGEYFVSPRAWAYLEAATRRGFAIRLFSALAALPPARLERLLDTNVFTVETSVHGADAATHDAFTRRPGSFAKLVASVRALRELGIPVVMKTCWTRYNFRQAGAILDLC